MLCTSVFANNASKMAGPFLNIITEGSLNYTHACMHTHPHTHTHTHTRMRMHARTQTYV